MRLTPVVFLHLLADRNLNPGSVELHVGEGDLNGLLPLIQDERFPAFVEGFPCLISADRTKQFPPELLAALLVAGCELAPEGSIFHSDEPSKPALPATTTWIAGNWYLAPPPKTSARQAASRAQARPAHPVLVTDGAV